MHGESPVNVSARSDSHRSRSAETTLRPRAPDVDNDQSAPPGLDIRVVLWTVTDSTLLVALHHVNAWAQLPRGIPLATESLDAAAGRIVRAATGLREHYLEQLYTLSIHDLPGWTVIVSYMALLCSQPHQDASPAGGWHPVNQLPPLSEADRKVVEYALVRLRAKLGYTNVAFHLLPRAFTLSELQQAYETILGRPLDKRNFRRRMIASGIVVPTEGKRREGSHRPAALYRFQPGVDRERYLTPPWATTG